MTTRRKSIGWSQVRAQLKVWAKPALTALIKDLYDASAANRDFLHARFQAEESGGAALEAYRRKIIEQFFPRRGFGKMKLAEALLQFHHRNMVRVAFDRTLARARTATTENRGPVRISALN